MFQPNQPSKNPEAGHASVMMTTFLAAVGIVLLTVGTLQNITILAWIGGIGAPILLVAQVFAVHSEFGKLWERIEQLETSKR